MAAHLHPLLHYNQNGKFLIFQSKRFLVLIEYQQNILPTLGFQNFQLHIFEKRDITGDFGFSLGRYL